MGSSQAKSTTTLPKATKRLNETIAERIHTMLMAAMPIRSVDQLTDSLDASTMSSFSYERGNITQEIMMTIERDFPGYLTKDRGRQEIVIYLEAQIQNRLKLYDTMKSVYLEHARLKRVAHQAEVNFKKNLDQIVYQRDLKNPKSALLEFDKMWKTWISSIMSEFHPELEWKRITDLVHQIYQTFNVDLVPDLNQMSDYTSLSMLVSSVQHESQWELSLNHLLHESISKASGVDPVIPKISDDIERSFDPKYLADCKFLHLEELVNAWSDDKMELLEANSTDSSSKYERIRAKVLHQWPLFMKTSTVFETLHGEIVEIFKSQYTSESFFDVTLIPDLIGCASALMKTVNLELDLFQLRLSDPFQNALHTYTKLSIACFYYDRRVAQFTQLVQSTEQKRSIMEEWFVHRVAPLPYRNENTTNHLFESITRLLYQSFEREAQEIVRFRMEEFLESYNSSYIKQALDDEIQADSDESLMRYLIHPMEFLKARVSQKYSAFKNETEIALSSVKKVHEEYFDDFKRLMVEVRTVLGNRNLLSTSTADNLGQSASNPKITENSQTEPVHLASLLYQYLVEDTMATIALREDQSKSPFSAQWEDIVKLLPKPGDKIKGILRSLKLQLDMCHSLAFETLFIQMLKEFDANQGLLPDEMTDFADRIMAKARNTIFRRLQGCTAQCPGCLRLCDVDHHSDKAFPMGHGDNRHRCIVNHQLVAIAGILDAGKNEALLDSCEEIMDGVIINYRGMRKSSWRSFKRTHSDWDFDRSESCAKKTKNERHKRMWNRIGQRLYQHYDCGMRFLVHDPSMKLNHFIFIFSRFTDTNPDQPSTVQRTSSNLQWLFGRGTGARVTEHTDISLHLSEHIGKLVSCLIQRTGSPVRITVLLNSSAPKYLYRAQASNEININQLHQAILDCDQSKDHSTAFRMMDTLIDQMRADPTLKMIKPTFVYISHGTPAKSSVVDLKPFFEKHSSYIHGFWTMVLGMHGEETSRELNAIARGTLLVVRNDAELSQAFNKMIRECGADTSTQSTTDIANASSDRIESLLPSTEISSDRSSFSLIPGERATTDEPQGNQDDAFIVTPPETMIYDQLYKISFPSREEDILPRILRSIATRILGSENNTTESILVPLPVLSKRSIDFLPTVNLTLDVEPRQFNMESFLQCLASDMKIDREEMVVTEAREGSVIMGFKLSRHIANNRKQLRNIEQILLSRELPSTRRFLATHIHSDPMPSTESNSAAEDLINVTLENFNNRTIDAIRLCPEVIDASLRMSEIKDILDRNEWKFLCEKTQQIAECLMHAFKHCPFDYTLENALLICNKTLVNQYRRKYGRRSDHEKLLFHGTDARNFEGIFKNNFQLSKRGQTDAGWYGCGFYFTNTPRKAVSYARGWTEDSIVHIIGCLVDVGKSRRIRDKSYRGKEISPDYNSHYVRVKLNGDPMSNDREPYYEEYVIRESDRILPLFIVGVRRAYRCVIWRDQRITTGTNNVILKEMRQRSPVNIYPSLYTDDALQIVQCKFFKKHRMMCGIITNGAQRGEGFVRECRRICPTIPVVVYCMKKDHHKAWVEKIPGPQILVTGNAEEAYQFIQDSLDQINA